MNLQMSLQKKAIGHRVLFLLNDDTILTHEVAGNLFLWWKPTYLVI